MPNLPGQFPQSDLKWDFGAFTAFLQAALSRPELRITTLRRLRRAFAALIEIESDERKKVEMRQILHTVDKELNEDEVAERAGERLGRMLFRTFRRAMAG